MAWWVSPRQREPQLQRHQGQKQARALGGREGTVTSTRDGVWGWHQLPVLSNGQFLGHTDSCGKLAPMFAQIGGQENLPAIDPTAAPTGIRAYVEFLGQVPVASKQSCLLSSSSQRPSQPSVLGAGPHYISEAYVPDDCSFSFQ